MDNRIAEMVVRAYIQSIPSFSLFTDTEYKEMYSYTKWAATEILDQILKNPNIPPLMIVEEFENRMEDYSLQNPNTSYMFSVAVDTATSIWICIDKAQKRFKKL